ncbi:MAG: LLM class flavin-dependent oxidoreductase [Gammaproteobacteria bacterium]|nr:LLM class flavin-dependent oxidoreductase [Gammaproteobacteria bacterium]MCY4278641.1 LLM class flavin-dependent oxidoreductase [Gammaproteobacteria bacterium]MCY4322461.1 LLM class flavin-dependent oxidoreductase [Gammaproteobacteria bacterium]
MQFAIFDEINAIEGLSVAEVYEEHLGQIEMADALGYHSYWLAEHHGHDHRFAPSPNLLLAAASQRTKRILLGNMVNVLPFHNPVRLAEEAAMLDHLSNGRIQTGIGRGIGPDEFKAYDVPMGESRPRFIESYGMMRKMWKNEAKAHVCGDFFSHGPVNLAPGVLQKPYPPVWFTGLSKESSRYAGEEGLPFVTAFLTNGEMKEFGDLYRESFRPSEFLSEPLFCVMRHVFVEETEAKARDEAGEVYSKAFAHWLQIALTEKRDGVHKSYKDYPDRHQRIGAMTLDELIENDIILFGDVAQVTDGVNRARDIGSDLTFIWVSPKGITPAQGRQCLTRFSQEIMPRFQ